MIAIIDYIHHEIIDGIVGVASGNDEIQLFVIEHAEPLRFHDSKKALPK